MYAKIKSSKSINDCLGYNERKLSRGKAQCILAENFAKDLEQLTRKDKLFTFQRLNELNQQAILKTFHISLNFHPDDHLSSMDLQEISKEYIQKMGLGRQPYLVYQHEDAAHPHVHIVGTAIQRDGRKVNLKEKWLHRSLAISRELEKTHSLVSRLKGMTREEKQRVPQAQKIMYGQQPTMPSLSQVVNQVVPVYKYTSLEELNAVLRLYHVEAYRGKENSALYQRRGLLYRVLNEQGHPTGSQIKASTFYSRPILRRLEERYLINRSEAQRLQHQQRITNAIDWALVKKSIPLSAFQKALEKERISAVWKQDPKGALQNIYYVDHQTKAVFDGHTLGSRYNAAAIQERCVPDPQRVQQITRGISQQHKSHQQQQQHEQEQELDLYD